VSRLRRVFFFFLFFFFFDLLVHSGAGFLLRFSLREGPITLCLSPSWLDAGRERLFEQVEE